MKTADEEYHDTRHRNAMPTARVPRPTRPSREPIDELECSTLVHRLQRERGVTCGLVASSRSEYFRELVEEQRRSTNELATDACTRAELKQVRAEADREIGDATRATTFYSVFQRFNALIQATLEAQSCSGRSTHEIYDAFVRLKEATGIQRAFLCGALALPLSSLAHLPSRAFADLVIVLQQQRQYERLIRDTAPPKLLELIRAGFEYSPELSEVQARLLDDFDVARLGQSLSADRCWQLLTQHIDKLERLQVLLYAEVEVQRASESATEAAVQQAIATLSSLRPTVTATASAAARIDALPAEAIKREVMALLLAAKKEAREHAHEPYTVGRAEGGESARIEPPGGSAAAEGPASVHGTRLLLRETASEAMLIGLDALVFRRRIGEGASGVTYVATFQGGTVAVKMASGSGGVEDWKREVKALTALRHPNIIRVMGVICATPSFGLVLEYCGGGDLCSALRNATPPGFLGRVSLGVSAGMMHLHERGVLHRDLKSANVLLDTSAVVKITDFGLAASAPDDTRAGGKLTAETGTYQWMAPEVCLHQQYSRSADVFSFGCVLFELVAHEPPFDDRSPLQAAVAVALNHERPTLPSSLPAAVGELINACWLREADARPTFASIHAQIEGLAVRLSTMEIAWLDAPYGHPVYRASKGSAKGEGSGEAKGGSSIQAAWMLTRQLRLLAVEGLLLSSWILLWPFYATRAFLRYITY